MQRRDAANNRGRALGLSRRSMSKRQTTWMHPSIALLDAGGRVTWVERNGWSGGQIRWASSRATDSRGRHIPVTVNKPHCQ